MSPTMQIKNDSIQKYKNLINEKQFQSQDRPCTMAGLKKPTESCIRKLKPTTMR
jgi:hypothetical protein